MPYGATGGCRARGRRRMARGPGAADAAAGCRAAPAVIVIFHPLQWPLARELLERARRARSSGTGAGTATRRPTTRRRRCASGCARCTTRRPTASALTFVASDRLAELERDAGREADARRARRRGRSRRPTGRGAASSPISLGHLGWRTDWALLRARRRASSATGSCCCSSARGTRTRSAATPTSGVPRAAEPRVARVALDDEAAARLIQAADVGIVPFERSAFNDAGLPYRILKYARLGRRTVCRRSSPGRADVGAGGDVRPDAAGSPTRCSSRPARGCGRTRAARVGARADRRAGQRAAVGAPARSWGRDDAASRAAEADDGAMSAGCAGSSRRCCHGASGR